MEEILKIEHLVKDFGTNKVLKDIDFSVYKGDVISIIGSSGSGKSTLLRCINMLEDATDGSILYHGKDILKGGVNEDAYRTRVGMVFQSFKEWYSSRSTSLITTPSLTTVSSDSDMLSREERRKPGRKP